MARKLTCLKCGSTDLIYPGFISLKWTRVGWRPDPTSWKAADGAPMHCQNCGARHVSDDAIIDPFTGLKLEPDRGSEFR